MDWVTKMENEEQNNLDELLICAVEQNSHLYDKSSKDYRDDKMKNNTWMSIAKELNSDASHVKKRWDNIRDRFVRNLRQRTEKLPSGSGYDGKPKTNFPYYNIMLWLVPYIRKRKMNSSVGGEKKYKNTSNEEPLEVWTEDIFTGVEPSTGLFEENKDVSVDTSATRSTSECSSNKEATLMHAAASAASQSSAVDLTLGHSTNSEPLPGPSSAIDAGKTKCRSKLLSPAEYRKREATDNFKTAVDTFNSFITSRQNSNTDEGDTNFMRSVVADMKDLSKIKKIRFKKEVLGLLEKYLIEEECN